jgi:hypothetical protein
VARSRSDPSDADAQAIAKALKGFDEDSKHHDQYVEKVNRWYRAYDGVMERRSKANDWTNKVTGRYVFQIIETMVSSLMDPRPVWRLRATARFETPPEVEALRMGARNLELLLSQQRRRPGFLTDQRAHRLQGLVAGLTAKKTYWDLRDHTHPRNVTRLEPQFDPFGMYAGDLPVVDREVVTETVADDPASEVVDVRHLIWPWNARSVHSAMRLHHRTYHSFDELKRRECKVNGGKLHTGACEGGYYHNVDQLKDSARGSDAREHTADETNLFRSRPDKDDHMVLETWHRDEDGNLGLTASGNRTVLLRDRESPFWHGEFPFIMCSGMPYPFQVPGISDVAAIEQLQEMMWTLQNQRLDNTQLVNNAIILLREDMDDPDSFEFYPGAKNLVGDPQQVQMWTPDPSVATISLHAEAQLKADLQAISGGAPWLSGDSQASNSDTATEASILTNLAQRRVAAKKQFYLEADAAEGDQFIALNDQFLTEARYVEIVGKDARQGWELIDPESFREFKFRVELDALDESLMRQERKAEASAMLQVGMQQLMAFAAMSRANPAVKMINPMALYDDWLEANGVRDKDRYYLTAPPPPIEVSGQSGQPQPGQPAQNGGVSAPQATDMNAPSNAFSQSPVAAEQQLMALAGGPANQ